MNKEHGSLSINSENIFPIIKKWLYSDHDIFFRELISNASDAVTKLKKLEVMGEVSLPDDNRFRIDVIVSPEDKTIKFIDNGIGMTEDEVKEYINQIAFSGAAAFLDQYKDKTNEEQIIGHFGLGFYSAFMVADKVTIDTLSWKDGAESVHWESEQGTEFEMSAGTKTTRGTEITLYLNEDSYEFSNEYRAKEVIEKYCSFMPVEIYFTNANAPVEEKTTEEATEEAKTEDIIDVDVDEAGKASESEEDEASEDGTETEEVAEDKGPKPINNTHPLWAKHPNDCTEEEYKEFYRHVFHDYKEPLFWIHLNMDYPFNLKGILYFPKLNTEYDQLEGTIKLYNNQVFIADNIKEVIPEFLMLLKGVIDCPDLPLNVSRSALQNDGFVKKISDYITKKVADKLSGMYKVDKENYEKYWDDISPFIKFGCLKDEKFREKMKEFIIFKNLEGKYISIPEYKEANQEKAKDNVYYVTDMQQQSQYINLFKEEGIDALILTHNIDQPFITQLEQQDEKTHFVRIDADFTDTFKEEVKEGEEADTLKTKTDTLTELFRKVLNKEKLEVKVEKLKNANVSSMITLSEESRRMQDMMKMYNMYGMDPGMFGNSETLVLNANNTLVNYIFEHKDSENVPMICEQLYDLALLSHKPLEAEAMTKFISRSNQIMSLLTE
ncbi:molecular chaperone HtpG [Anaeromicropila herbilytica]|uniref:Molecular chaperone HtpG n=1 Tax=Anaeromicropila herbilytica TaxID=2785025 RepID=A0A7R7IDQ6_9FIRM|nr:molecular chaperone HtpG [Anaeromicropila herbilytica]BCN30263.1 molecular chaperone HtpG [Anaeromicropila herbilytica]